MTASKPNFSMTKFPKALAAAGLAAVLVGCGGGGGDSTSAPPSPSEPTQPPAPTPTDAKRAAERVMTSYDAAEALVNSLNNQSSEAERKLANNAIEDFREDIQESDDLSTEDRSNFLSKLTDLRRDLNRIDTAAATIDKWETSIMGYNISPDMERLPDRVGKKHPGTSILTTTRSGISFTYDGTPEPGTPVSGLPSGWTGTSHKRNYADGRVDSGKIFSDLPSAPESWEWDDLWNQQAVRPNSFLGGVPLAGLGFSSAGAIETTTKTGNDFIQIPGVLRDNNATNIVRINVVGGSFKTGLRSSNVTSLPPTTITDGKDNSLPAWGTTFGTILTRRGSLFGVEGNFQCSIECQINNNGGLLEIVSLVSDDTSTDDDESLLQVTFTPDTDKQSTINSQTFYFTKPDYAEFGYWSLDGGELEIDTFAKGTYGTTNRGLTATPANITGTATYDGLAAGYYILSHEDEFHNGEFKANAKLSADFDSNTISGMISGFDSETEDAHDSHIMDWELSLNDANIGTTATSFKHFSGPTTGNGVWQGTLYGNVGTALGVNNDTNDYPKAVVGEFAGSGFNDDSDNQVVGAFAAEYED